ncbi:MAG: hypothetical protein JXB00_16015 [Bacteroidales bacterium]|nr:hypothetical protein [Bacteroidales bacterium]
MRNFNYKYHLAVLFLQVLLLASVFANDDGYKKKYKREYNVQPGTQLQIENKYGNVDIKNWDRKMISVEVTITVGGSNEEKAQNLFDQIDIQFSELGNIISVKTEFQEDFGKLFQQNSGKLIDISYSVMMPATIPLQLENKYGNVYINELHSTSTIDIKYGNLKANRLLHNGEKPLMQVNLAYSSNTSIQEAVWIKFDIKYSNVEVEDSKALVILSKYSKVFVTNGTSIVSESKYDTYRLGKLTNLVTTAGYTNFKVQEITEKLVAETKYSDFVAYKIPATFEGIKVISSYGNYTLAVEQGASYHIDGFAKYAKITIPDNARVNRFNENNEQKINGLVGNNSNTRAKVYISTNYGGVKLTE